MSVVNKMLRDLDRRHAAGAVSPMAGTRAVAGGDLDATPRGTTRRWLPLLLAMLAGCAVAALGLMSVGRGLLPGVGMAAPAAPAVQPVSPVSSIQSVVAVPAPTAPLVSVNALATPAVAVSAPSAATGVVRADTVIAPKKVAKDPYSTRADVSIPSQVSAPSRAQGPVQGTVQGPVHKAGDPVVAASAPPASHSPVQALNAAPSAGTPPAAARWPAAQEALAQAQSLWNGGSRDGAIALLREAVALAQRSPPGSAGSAGSPGPAAPLVPLVRELARMELAEGQVAQAHELLVRLEPQLSPYADLWAVRGNAAQRLGHHAESVQAYLNALKIRPNEPRWMLGAAVSLAVQGHTAAAAEWAEKARAQGFVSAETFAYLRQLGVPLPE